MKQIVLKVLASVLLLGGITSASLAADPIRIGVVLSSTGPVGFIGEPQQKTLELMVKNINAEGGVLGRKLELVLYDDASEPARASTFTRRLVEADNVDLIIGGTITPTSMAMIPVIERAGIPYISIGGGLPIIDPVKKWVFKTPHTDRQVAERILIDLKERGISTIAILSETSGFGQSGYKEVLALAPKYEMKVLVDEKFGPKDTDITPQLTAIRRAPEVKGVIIFVGAGPSPAMAIKNFAQLGIDLPVYLPHSAASQEFLRLAGAAAEKVRLPAPAFVVADAMPASDPQKAVAEQYYRSYLAAYGTAASPFGGNISDALMIAVDALKRAKTTDKSKVRDAIEQTKGLVGLNGIFTMSPSDHLGLETRSLRIFEVQNNKFVFLK